jgi:hypothetical protein
MPTQHQTKRTPMIIQSGICAPALALTLAVTGLALRVGAADEKPANNPSGTWKVMFPNQTNAPTLKLKLQGDKLTGTMSRQAGYKIEELALENGKLKGDEISFATRHFATVYVKNVLQPTDTNQVTLSTYRGKISGDAIKGKVERDTRGTFANVRTLDWEAKRLTK